MSPRTPQTVTAPPLTLRIAPGQSLWTCLEPGCMLYATQGEVALRLAPEFYGAMAHPTPPTPLKAGEQFPCTDRHQTIWVELGSATEGSAEVKVVPGVPRTGLARKTWALVCSVFAGQAEGPKGGRRGVLQAPQ